MASSTSVVLALVPCAAPTVPLLAAPRSVLVDTLACADDEGLETFWGEDEQYYACRREASEAHWYVTGVVAVNGAPEPRPRIVAGDVPVVATSAARGLVIGGRRSRVRAGGAAHVTCRVVRRRRGPAA